MTAPLAFEGLRLGGRDTEPFTLAVPEHHTVAVLGDEDSGVGTLGGYALGLERSAAGRATVFGVVIADLPQLERLAFRRRVGYLPAGEGLLQNLSLRDNVALPLRFAAQRRPAQANEEERRRAAIARATAFDPALVIMEQPFDGLTARAAAELLEFVRGGETAEGARRTILITGQELPAVIHRRIERTYRLTRAGALELEPA